MARRVLKWAREIGIQRFAYFIIGYYSDTPQSMRRTINFAKEIDPDWVMFTAATPLPKTNLFDLCLHDGLVDENYWLDFMKGKNDGRMDYLVPHTDKWIRRAYIEFYFRPSFIIRKIMNLGNLLEFVNYMRGAIAILRIG